MKLASEFSVPAAPAAVFPLLFDPEVMRGLVPGCQELVRVDERTYRGRLVNEIAHVRFSADFSADIQSVSDGATKEVSAVLRGQDRKLGSSIKVDAKLSVRPDGDDASVIAYEMDMALWGKLGRLGEPIIRKRSKEVEQEFARALALACGAPAESLPPAKEKSTRRRAATRAAPTQAPAAATATQEPAAAAAAGDVELAVAATRKLAVAALVVSIVSLFIATLRRRR